MKHRVLESLKSRLLLFLIGVGVTFTGGALAFFTIIGWFIIYTVVYVMLLFSLLAIFSLND